MSLFSEMVELVKRPEVVGHDSVNDPIYGEPKPVQAAGWVDKAVNGEILDRRETLTEAFTLYLDGLVDLAGVDTIRYRDGVYQIEGEPARQAGGFIVGAYTVVPLSKVEG